MLPLQPPISTQEGGRGRTHSRSKISKLIESLQTLSFPRRSRNNNESNTTVGGWHPSVQVPVFRPSQGSRPPSQSKKWERTGKVVMPEPNVLKSPNSSTSDPALPLRLPSSTLAFPVASTSLAVQQSTLASAEPPTSIPTNRPSSDPRLPSLSSPQLSSSACPSPLIASGKTHPSDLCQGTTRDGRPCSRKPMKYIDQARKVEFGSAIDHIDEVLVHFNAADGSPLPKYCYQHHQKVTAPTGAYFGKSIWIEYTVWIPKELPDQTKLVLRAEMTKHPTDKDRNQKGYLYCHEMKPSSKRTGKTYIKVGRSIRPVARLGEWAKQCPSRRPIVRGFYPEAESKCYLDGAQSVAPHGISFHCRWERLCLIEIAGWADLQRQGRKRAPCTDCGKVHQELFELDEGSFEQFVKPVIKKWQHWCSFAYE